MEAEVEARKSHELNEQRDELSRNFGELRLDVYRWEENWRIVKACQDFLYRVSPNKPQQLEPKSASESVCSSKTELTVTDVSELTAASSFESIVGNILENIC